MYSNCEMFLMQTSEKVQRLLPYFLDTLKVTIYPFDLFINKKVYHIS
jgi:hypothetical protein